jgi:ParB-like chromosome segregation protein Spo0J
MTQKIDQLEYFIKEFKRVNLNLLEPDEIRSKRYEDAEKFAGLRGSIKDFTQIAPLIVRETSNISKQL